MRKFRVEPKYSVTASTSVSEESIRKLLEDYFRANPEEFGIIGDAEAYPDFQMFIDNEVKLLLPVILSVPGIENAKSIRIDIDESPDGPDYALYVDDEIYGLEMGRDNCFHLLESEDIQSSVVVYSSVEDDDAAYHRMVQDMKSNDAYKHLAEVAQRYGYTLYSANLTRRGDIEFTVQPDDPHAPDIYLGSATVGTYFAKPGDVKVRIATVSQGSLILDEYATYMKHVQDAFAFGKFLEDWDGFKDLYRIEGDVSSSTDVSHAVAGKVILSDNFFYDLVSNMEDNGWDDVLQVFQENGWVRGNKLILPRGTELTKSGEDRYYVSYQVSTSAGTAILPFLRPEFGGELPA